MITKGLNLANFRYGFFSWWSDKKHWDFRSLSNHKFGKMKKKTQLRNCIHASKKRKMTMMMKTESRNCSSACLEAMRKDIFIAEVEISIVLLAILLQIATITALAITKQQLQQIIMVVVEMLLAYKMTRSCSLWVFVCRFWRVSSWLAWNLGRFCSRYHKMKLELLCLFVRRGQLGAEQRISF